MSKPSTSQRFAVLRHEGVPEPHFDLLVDVDGVSPLATWRCEEWPIVSPRILLRQSDHRRIYLDYEGLIRGNRGQVRRVDAGPCRVAELSADHWQIARAGAMTLDLVRLDGDRWQASPISADPATPKRN